MTAAKSADVRWLLKDALGVVFKRKRLILGLFLIVITRRQFDRARRSEAD